MVTVGIELLQDWVRVFCYEPFCIQYLLAPSQKFYHIHIVIFFLSTKNDVNPVINAGKYTKYIQKKVFSGVSMQ